MQGLSADRFKMKCFPIILKLFIYCILNPFFIQYIVALRTQHTNRHMRTPSALGRELQQMFACTPPQITA
jgi:hypothetical protein